ncbi:hypothetical protein TNIN_279231 [Trichonephila inaurata madagascariensis]|uniref:Uncharacterized protein n=1 Tax=Trichonephila inaurata madagascariensis TaxID=2747483 RepID=A0A8X6Y9X9_9ARAC|nr:hypothetical protein TNIN_279231 [Trichonephila inaurata madagascariensis]
MNDPIGSPKQAFIVEDKKLSFDSSVVNAFVQHFCGANSKNTYTKIHSSRVKQKNPILLQSELESSTDSIFEAPITRNKLTYALRSLPCGKSLGRDGIHSKFLSHLGPRAFKMVWIFFNLIVPAE